MSDTRPLTVVAYTGDAWESACPHLRIVAPFERAGIRVIRGSDWEAGQLRVHPEYIADGDVVLVQRDFPRLQESFSRIAQRAAELGKPLIYELDDLLIDLPEDHPDFGHYKDARWPMLLAAMEADAVTVATPALAAALRQYNPRVYTLPNYLDDAVWQLPDKPTVVRDGGPVVIGYAGGRSHAPDLEDIAPVLSRLLDAYGPRLQLRFWGKAPVPPALLNRPGVVWDQRHDLNYARYAQRFTQPQADIFIAPLLDTPFNAAKSAVKYLEYSASGVCGVYGACEPYRSIVVDGENGLLAGAADEWEAALRQLIDDADLRRRMGQAALETVRGRRRLSDHADQWRELIERVCREHRGQPGPVDAGAEVCVDIEQQLAERDAALKALAGEHIRALKNAQSLVHRLAEDEAKLAANQALIETLAAKQKRLEENAAWLEAELQRTRASITWRATEPVRKAYGWVEGGRARRRAEALKLPARASGADEERGATVAPGVSAPRALAYATTGYQSQRFFWSEETFAGATPLPLSPVTDIIICIGRSTALAEKCIRSIEEFSTPGSYRLKLVVHRDDVPNLPANIRAAGEVLPHALDIFNFSMANNLALRQCPGDVVLLNDDTEVTPGWLDQLRADSRGIALTGPRTGRQCSGNPDMWGDGPLRVTWYPVNMFCAFIPSRVREVIGLLDEEFFYYGGEDVEYSCRALQHGFPLVVSSAFVKHTGNQTFKGAKERLMQESDKILYERFGLTPPFALDALKPTVSVVTATHNRASDLPAAVRSILSGSFPELEAVVVDDGSSDNTPAVIARLQGEDARVTGIRLPRSAGAVGARAVGLRASSGNFIALMDDDDIAWPDRILAPLQFLLTHPELDVAYCDFEVVSDTGRQRGAVRPFDLQDYLRMKFDIGLGVLLLRRHTLVNVPFMRYYERATDYDWVFRIARRGYRLEYCPAVVLDYNRRGPVDAHLAGTDAALRQHKMIQEREHLVNQQRRK